uniref:Uncharacterized protein n=1 Tax=Salvator merianae TaxID=96440 RepID=A0A8D0B3V6_SALMN
SRSSRTFPFACLFCLQPSSLIISAPVLSVWFPPIQMLASQVKPPSSVPTLLTPASSPTFSVTADIFASAQFYIFLNSGLESDRLWGPRLPSKKLPSKKHFLRFICLGVIVF